jgi:2-polyprenyl-3-methyl-5-hydroxy-6-metoxy-1,4-benzoquinol methylase
VIKKPSAKSFKGLYSEKYFSHGKYNDVNTLRRENRRRLNLMNKFLPNSEVNILDFGCGPGDFIRFVDHKHIMWGLDYSEYAIQQARKANPGIKDRIKVGLIEEQNYSICCFDAIVMWDVIEHLWDIREVLKNLLNFLKSGGLLFISTVNIGSIFANITGRYWPMMTPPEHLNFFTNKSFKYLFEKEFKCKVRYRQNKGKWANIGFIFYKIKRIFPKLIPTWLIRLFQNKFTKYWSLYVPTGDIQYLVVQKNTES